VDPTGSERRRPAARTDDAADSFRWPEERRRATPPGSPEQPEALSPAWHSWAQRGLLAAGTLGSLWIYLAPTPVGLSAAGKTAAAIFLFCTTLWVTNIVPFGVTGLLAISLLGILGAMRPAEAFAAFGNSAVFFLIGVFIIGGALVDSGLSKRLALLFLRPFERSPYSFATGMMLVAAFGTLWMPNQATSAMLFPICVEVALALRLRQAGSTYAKVLFLSLAWGAMVGSNASMLGSTRAALALGMLQESYGRTISFSQWVIASLPMVLLALLIAPLVLRFCFRREEVQFASARALLERSVRDMGRANRRQWTVGIVVALTIASWMALGDRVDLAIISIFGAATLFATRAISWEEAEKRIFWNIVLMYGGAIALGVAIDRTGAARWLVETYMAGVTIPPLLAVAAAVIGTMLLSEFMSNVAAVAVMLPLAYSLGDQLGASPMALTLATSIGAGLDFALPFSSAPNTIVFASGYLRMTDVVKAGGIMTVASVLIVWLVAWLWWPVIGLL
jgi:solute carrier family 13 (sodium-dependent dicarboxylate transporter), member 2/3/5